MGAIRLLLVRHAAHARVAHILCGRMAGVDLDAAGMAQAERLAARLQREDPVAVHSSPQPRARQTATPIARRFGLSVAPAPALDEIDCGDWTGRDFGTLAEDPLWRRWNECRSSVRPPGGTETMAQVQARALGFARGLGAQHAAGGAVVAVSHADVIKAVLLGVLGLPLDAHWRIDGAPASVCTLLLAGEERVLGINERIADG